MINHLALMVAPNGARKSSADHPGLPITVDAIAAEAAACREAGAQALHLHVRDDAGRHTLDAAGATPFCASSQSAYCVI